MRDYGKVAPQFWTGETGRQLKAGGPEAIVVAMYLMTSPHANMIGLYYLPKLYLAHETGLGMEGACKGLARAIEAGFCSYDEASEYVFVHAMARFQIADTLDPKDKRCKGVENEASKVPKGLLRNDFFARYGVAFHIENGSPFEAPSKPLRSQEQEQEQEQKQEQGKSNAPARKRAAPKTALPDGFGISDDVRAWAEAKGHHSLELHLEHFVGSAKARGYTYADWDAAFRNAIRDDWAKVGQRQHINGVRQRVDL